MSDVQSNKSTEDQTLFDIEDANVVVDPAIEVVETEVVETEAVGPAVESEQDSVANILAKQMQKPIEDDEDSLTYVVSGEMEIGECKFGITCTGEPLGTSHWLADSLSCGDMVMGLPSSVLIAARTKQGSGVAVDMAIFLDAIVEGAAQMCGVPGIVEAAGLPMWAVTRLMGSFPALMAAYHESMDQAVLTVEAAAMKASTFMVARNTRKVTKEKTEMVDGKEIVTEKFETTETLDKEVAPDPALSKFILTSRMSARYKDMGDVKQAVQVNIYGAEADV